MKKECVVLLSALLIAALLCFPARAEEEDPIAVLPISYVKAFPQGTPGISFRGTVVWEEEDWAILQDDTDSICVSMSETFGQGETLLITGQSGGERFEPERVVSEGHGALPAVEATLADLPEKMRVVIRGGWLEGETMTQDGYQLEICTEEETRGWVDIWGIWVEDCFYADTIEPGWRPTREQNVWFGLLDAHSNLSDGVGSAREAFSCASQVENLDFFALTDHSDSFDNGQDGEILRDGCTLSSNWAEGKQAAAEVTGQDFVGIFGYEMSWGEDKALGHINTFNTPGWQTARQPEMKTLADYCEALAGAPTQVSQFNHPGGFYGSFGEFMDYDPACDRMIQLLQVEGEGGASFYSYYIQALDAGWHVAPTVGQDNHNGGWGEEGSSRTAVLTGVLSETALYEAMRAHRVYATQDADLYIDYRLNGHIMGSIIGEMGNPEIHMVLDDPTDAAIGSVEVISTGGSVLASCTVEKPFGELTMAIPEGYPWYFLRVTQPDGDVSVTAPVWLDDYSDIGIASFVCETENPLAGQEISLSLSLFNRELADFAVTGVSLQLDDQQLGEFTPAGNLSYCCRFYWNQPGTLELTAQVQGTVNGEARSYQKTLTLLLDEEKPIFGEICEVRNGVSDQVYAIEGYAVSGNASPYTTFPDTIYVQDDTGGIPVVGAFSQSFTVGTPLSVHGILREGSGERYLELTQCQIRDAQKYRYQPQSLSCREAMDYESWGGRLVRMEGTVTQRTVTADGMGVSHFLLQDSWEDTAQVVIDPYILSQTYGVNQLANQLEPGNTVRVTGLLSRNEKGESFLRVRNCDEVNGQAPEVRKTVADEDNPYNGEGTIGRILLMGAGKLGETVAFIRKLCYSFYTIIG